MRIHSVDAIAIDITLKKNFGGATYSVLKRSTVITRLRTEGGLTSEVYNGDNREHGPEIVRLIKEELAPLVLGLSMFESERIWENIVRPHRAQPRPQDTTRGHLLRRLRRLGRDRQSNQAQRA